MYVANWSLWFLQGVYIKSPSYWKLFVILFYFQSLLNQSSVLRRKWKYIEMKIHRKEEEKKNNNNNRYLLEYKNI